MLKLWLNFTKTRLALPGSAWQGAGAFPAQQSIARLMGSSLTLNFLELLWPWSVLLAQLWHPSLLDKGNIQFWTSEKKLQVFNPEQLVQGSPLPLTTWEGCSELPSCTTTSPAHTFSERSRTDSIEAQLMFPFINCFTASSHGKLFHIPEV